MGYLMLKLRSFEMFNYNRNFNFQLLSTNIKNCLLPFIIFHIQLYDRISGKVDKSNTTGLAIIFRSLFKGEQFLLE